MDKALAWELGVLGSTESLLGRLVSDSLFRSLAFPCS